MLARLQDRLFSAALTPVLISLACVVGTGPMLAQTPSLSGIVFDNSPASGDTYTRGEPIGIRVDFDGKVEYSEQQLLRLALRVGSVTVQASPRQWGELNASFTYTVQASDLDTDGISVPANPLSLNGGAITVLGDSSTAVTLTHAGVGDDATRKVDGSQAVAPSIQGVRVESKPLVGDTFRRGETIVVAVNFDKAVRVIGQPQLALTIGTSTRQAIPDLVVAIARTVRFLYTVEASDRDDDGISIAADAISLNGGAIELADGTLDADISHAAVAASPPLKVDGTLVAPPKVTRVFVGFAPPDGVAYLPGEEIRARAVFDQQIEVTGRPQLALTIGTTRRLATFSRIWGSTFMEFLYTVQVSDSDLDGISIPANALTLNGGSITAADRVHDAVLTHAAVDDDAEHKVDATSSPQPQLQAVGFVFNPSSGDTYKRGERIYIDATFDRMAEISGTPRLAVTIGSETRYATFLNVATPRPFRINFAYTVQASDTDSDGISIPSNAMDLNGGAITLPGAPSISAVLTHDAVASDPNRKVDGSVVEPPTVSAVAFTGSPASGTAYTAGERIVAYVQFSNQVDVTGEPELALEIGTQTRQASFERVFELNPTFILLSYIVQASDVDTDGISIPADALTLNGGAITLRGDPTTAANLTHAARSADSSRLVDGTDTSSPEVLSLGFSNSPPSGDTYVFGEEITVGVQFSKAVTVAGSPGLALTIGGNTRQALYQSTGGACGCVSRFSYTVQATDTDTDGISISANSLTLRGGSIRHAEASSVDAELSHSAVNADATRKVSGATSPAVPVLSINSPSVTEGNTGSASLDFVVTLTGSTSQQVTVAYSDADTGSATSGTDYTAVTDGTLTFAAGETSKTVTVSVTGDTAAETNETVVLRLSSPSNATLSGGGAMLDGTGTIIDDDGTPGLTLSSARASLTYLKLVFSTELDMDSVPPASAFAVSVEDPGGTATSVTVQTVAVAGTDVILELASGVVSGQVVKVSYTVPTAAGEAPIQDATGNDAASFTDYVVTVADSDVTGDGAIDRADARVMFIAYEFGRFVGDGSDSSGIPAVRGALLQFVTGDDTTDADLREMLGRANAWPQSAGAYGDVTGDEMVDRADARVMFIAYEFGRFVGDGGDSSGIPALRAAALQFVTGDDTTDPDLREMLRKANAIRDPSK